MKKLFLGLMLVAGMAAISQTVNDIPLTDIKGKYIQIVGTKKAMNNKVNIEIDFGQENKVWDSKDTQLRNDKGELMEFNSMIDALNFFADVYEFDAAYVVTVGNQNVYYYLLKRLDIK